MGARGAERVGAIILGLALVTMAVPQLVGVQASHAPGWNLDLDSGLEWRWVEGDELDGSPWPGEDVNAMHGWGSLSAFDTEDTVDVTFAANGKVFSLQFEFTGRTHGGTFVTMTSSSDGTVPDDPTRAVDLTGRIYRADPPLVAPDGTSEWAAVKMSDHSFVASGSYDGDYVEVLPNQPSFTLNGDVGANDLISVVPSECDTSGGGPVIGGGGVDPCPSGGPVPPDVFSACEEACEYFFYWTIEFERCHRIGDNWESVLGLYFDASESVFSDTVVKPKFGGGVCWEHESRTFHHDEHHRHCHEQGCPNPHPYPFNPVTTDHECDIYQENVGEDLSHTLGHGFAVDGDNLQVVHQDECSLEDDTYGGYADLPGSTSITTASAWAGGPLGASVSAHEFGHNFHADHFRAWCISDPFVSIMGNWDGQTGTPNCVDGDEERVWIFSDGNINEVNNCASSDCTN